MAKLSLAGVEPLLIEGTLGDNEPTPPGGGITDGEELLDSEGVGIRVG